MALDTTVGSNSGDSYVTVAEADEYLEAVYGDNLSTNWSDLDEAPKEQRLKIAALLMNTFPWRGVKASRNQRLEFPRWWRTEDNYEYIVEDEDYILEYSDIEGTAPTIPAEVKYSQIEIAYQVITYIMTLDSLAFSEKEIKMFELGGSLGIEFFPDSSESSQVNKAKLSSLDIVYAYLGRWYRRFSGAAI
jgi:hypothetical protein